mmetsp:Transcript_76703/g.201267  ORF Transcript_76703/g.201267 Transcript_76703/m.201267 type:complete len:312 (+) Transcript_76703:601-1536(+)
MLKMGMPRTRMTVSIDTLVERTSMSLAFRFLASDRLPVSSSFPPYMMDTHLRILERRAARAPNFAALAVRIRTGLMPESASCCVPAEPSKKEISKTIEAVPMRSMKKKKERGYVFTSATDLITCSATKKTSTSIITVSMTLIHGSSGRLKMMLNALPKRATNRATTDSPLNHTPLSARLKVLPTVRFGSVRLWGLSFDFTVSSQLGDLLTSSGTSLAASSGRLIVRPAGRKTSDSRNRRVSVEAALPCSMDRMDDWPLTASEVTCSMDRRDVVFATEGSEWWERGDRPEGALSTGKETSVALGMFTSVGNL